jgi:two-component system OmpR family response regulator
MRVLVVEDEVKMAGLLRRALEEEGYAVDVAANGAEGVWLGTENEHDAVLLDLMLPDIDGFDVCRKLREAGRWSPVLMLTARDAVADRVAGLDAGADDYLTKPFSPGELVARIRAMLRRPRGETQSAAGEETPLSSGDLSVDRGRREVRLGGREVSLTAIEFDLLAALISRPGLVFSREQLLARVWGEDYFGGDHVVDVHVANLRKKIEADPSNPRYVQTVRGVGYRFRRP